MCNFVPRLARANLYLLEYTNKILPDRLEKDTLLSVNGAILIKSRVFAPLRKWLLVTITGKSLFLCGRRAALYPSLDCFRSSRKRPEFLPVQYVWTKLSLKCRDWGKIISESDRTEISLPYFPMEGECTNFIHGKKSLRNHLVLLLEIGNHHCKYSLRFDTVQVHPNLHADLLVSDHHKKTILTKKDTL